MVVFVEKLGMYVDFEGVIVVFGVVGVEEVGYYVYVVVVYLWCVFFVIIEVVVM